MDAHIRPFDFSDRDYQSVVAIDNAVFPDYRQTVTERRFEDENQDPKIRWARFVVEVEGEPVGFGSYGQSIDMYHPRKFGIGTTLLKPWQGKGIGNALYDHLLTTLAPFDPILIRAHAREDYERSVRFLTERGFTEAMRDWESRLDPRTFDPAPFEPAARKVAEQGIVLKSLAALADDPQRDEKLFELDWAVILDMPSTDVLTKPTFEHFRKTVLGNPGLLLEGWFVALDGDRYVGESALWKSEGEPGVLYVGATGVLREYRRRGIATALKLAAVDWAHASGCTCIKTWNAQQNRAMLSINEAMGFVKQPAWISYEKKLSDE